MNKECECKECVVTRNQCIEIFDTMPRELVWLIYRFARANPVKEVVPREFISYPRISMELYHTIPHHPELFSEYILKFLYPKNKPIFSTQFSESWTVLHATFKLLFDTINFEWIGTIEVSNRIIETRELMSYNIITKPSMVYGGNVFDTFVYPFFGANLESNCYYAMKRVLKEYEYEINKKIY
jgi:hypothetical protein